MYTLRQYLLTLSDTRGLTRTLGEIDLCRDDAGRPLFSVGNSAAVFRCRREGRLRALRCYLRPMRHLAEIYGAEYLPRELYLYTTPDRGLWVDAVLTEWIEGQTLDRAVRRAAEARDRERLGALSRAFRTLAAELVADDRAHGDLKPENIVVDAAGALHTIDRDAAFLPAFAGERSPELGTAAFQHPARTADDYDARLDDYPAALISTALSALALDPGIYGRYRHADGLLFTPQRIHTDPALGETLALFERHGCAAAYRIARLLLSPTLRLPRLPALLDALRREEEFPAHPAASDSESPGAAPESADENTEPTASAEVPELFAADGLWGYRRSAEIVVPPLYDCGFDFSEGLAAVLLGRTWHYIDTAGRRRISCPGCEAVKPFRGGRATVVRQGRRRTIDRAGNVLDI